jgi:hypothetical protein
VKFCLSFLTKPLQIFGVIGLASLLPGAAICVYLAFSKLVWGSSLATRPLLQFGILLAIIGVQFLCMGILAEIQIRTYHESSNRPIYAIRELLESPAQVNSMWRRKTSEERRQSTIPPGQEF